MALVLAMVMVVAMGVTVFAAESDYKITVTNDNSSISIDGQVYSAYKLFDLSYNTDKTAYSYTISTSSYFYTTSGAKTVLDKYFTFTASAADSTVMVVEPKTDGDYYNSTTKTISDAGARQLADDLQQFLASATPVKTGTASGQTAEITVGEDGYFIVTGSATPTDPEASETVVSAVILTNAQPTASVKPKVSIPTLNKKITGVTEDGSILDNVGQAAVAKVGAKVSYQLDSITPDLRGYTDYTFKITDTITSGLTYDNTSLSSLVLKIGGTTVDATSEVEGVTVTNYSLSVSGQTFTLTIPYATLSKYDAGTAIVVTYDAVVNSNAVSYDYDKNTANLEYSHSPYDETTNKTPDKETYVLNINIDVEKVDGSDSSKKLANATFKLYKTVAGATTYVEANEYEASATYYSDAEGTTEVTIDSAETFAAAGTLYVAQTAEDSKLYYKWDNNKVTWVSGQENGDAFTTNADGNLTQQIRGLDKGTYYLEETVAPSGYNLLASPVTVNISATEADNKVTYTVSGATVSNGEVDLTEAQNTNQPVAKFTVENNSGSVLPSTGGIGTTIFYVIGAVLVIGACVLLVTRSRMNNNK